MVYDIIYPLLATLKHCYYFKKPTTSLMEFGELNASDVPSLTKGKLERLFIVNMNEDFDYVTLLKKANAMRYNVSVINNTQTLLLF